MKIFKYAQSEEHFPGTVPASTMIPKWYKDIEPINKNTAIMLNNPDIGGNIKNCMPFLDSLTTGYFILLPQDIIINQKDGDVSVTWRNGQFDVVKERMKGSSVTHPAPSGCLENHFVWITQVNIKLPTGYSALLTHPLNRFDLPFVTMSGIFDGDGFISYSPGNIPFFIKKDFNGIIEAGTPIAQVIPFKREEWKSEYDKNLVSEGRNMALRSVNRILGWYKNTYWHKKVFE